MSKKIQELLTELVNLSVINDKSVSYGARQALSDMKTELKKLAKSDDPKKQEKMIKIYIGGMITALHIDDQKYQHNPKLYPRSMVINIEQKLAGKIFSDHQYYYTVGHEAVSELPQSFCGELFKIKSNLLTGLAPFSLSLANNANKIDQLVAFCLDHPNDLESTDFVKDKVPPYHFSKNFIEEFVNLHRKSYQGSFLSFFKKTQLKPYNQLSVQDILDHSKKSTFFGFKNRTRQILEDMKAVDKKGNLLDQNIPKNLFK